MVGSFCRTQKKRSKQVPAGLPQNQVNSAFGRTMESMLNRKKVEIVTTEMELLEKTSKSNMKSFQIIDDQIATLSLEVSSEKWTEPNLVGAETLYLAKK